MTMKENVIPMVTPKEISEKIKQNQSLMIQVMVRKDSEKKSL